MLEIGQEPSRYISGDDAQPGDNTLIRLWLSPVASHLMPPGYTRLVVRTTREGGNAIVLPRRIPVRDKTTNETFAFVPFHSTLPLSNDRIFLTRARDDDYSPYLSTCAAEHTVQLESDKGGESMLTQDRYQTIHLEKGASGVTVATLNRPEKLNAINAAMHTELATLTIDADADPDVKVLLVTGAGRAFSAGGDFSGQGDSPTTGGGQTMREARQIVDNLLDFSKPIISAVNGYAMGLGANFALLTDVVVAARGATFADTHVRMGIGAGDGGQVIWPLLMGVNRAKYFLMTGDRLPAEDAERLGLVNFVVDDEELMPKAREIAERLASGPAYAISASKVPVNKYIKMISNLVLPLSLSLEGATMAGADAREAAQAFREKRDPKFTGR